MAYIKIVLAFFLSITQFMAPYGMMIKAGGVDGLYEDWSAEDAYTEEYAVTLEKDPGKDFVILNFADIQLSDDKAYGELGEFAEETMDKLIKETKPDLITLTGDNATGKMSYIRLANFIDSYGIPWAPVMGNHDGENGKKLVENWDACILAAKENCLFKFGPKDMGVGNYVINITENGKIIHTLFMMDTHTNTDLECGGYDHLWDNQIEWYAWAVNGISRIAGGTVESSIFFHIPCIQYRDAWNEAQYNEETGEYENPDYADSFGSNSEAICSPEYDSGFFETVKDLGSTKNIISGHDHVNDSSIMYEGVRLSYSLKTGHGSYWEEGKNGGGVLTIDSDGHAVFSNQFVD